MRIEPAHNRVGVGPKDALAQHSIYLKDINWLGTASKAPETGWPVMVKLRSSMDPVAAHFMPGADGCGEIRLEVPHHGVAPGQAGVIYDRDRLLGGGWITGAEIQP